MVKSSKIIKRYQNRKLYDTEASTYVTLDDIASMIRRGEDVTVVDNKSKKDITSNTLTQIILESEKKTKHVLPIETLKNIIQQGSGSLSQLIHKSVESGKTSLTHAKEEAEKQIEGLLKRLEHPAKTLDDVQKKLDERIRTAVENFSGAQALQQRIEKLTKQVQILEKKLSDFQRGSSSASPQP
ncbi:MAG TPA: polyhydroxyalkanoate synthesis regulator DNA-binding domain-containing protein [Bdellovibrionota bacterium]|nr:polyhydroxyalkanoate synthesis regulator DNA-binding domain-containing protein [Bdellovibrionota bacterium]